MYILKEYVQGKEVFDYQFHTGKFEDSIARAYFKQMINGL